jgi:DNA-binding transcriptional ArsR family regulator
VNLLTEAGLVASRKDGRERLCRPQLQELKRIYEWAVYYEQFWTIKLNALARHLDAVTDLESGQDLRDVRDQ